MVHVSAAKKCFPTFFVLFQFFKKRTFSIPYNSTTLHIYRNYYKTSAFIYLQVYQRSAAITHVKTAQQLLRLVAVMLSYQSSGIADAQVLDSTQIRQFFTNTSEARQSQIEKNKHFHRPETDVLKSSIPDRDSVV